MITEKYLQDNISVDKFAKHIKCPWKKTYFQSQDELAVHEQELMQIFLIKRHFFLSFSPDRVCPVKLPPVADS